MDPETGIIQKRILAATVEVACARSSCGNIFVMHRARPRKYCERDCADEARREHMKRNYYLQICYTCGITFYPDRITRKFCSRKCAGKASASHRSATAEKIFCKICGKFIYTTRVANEKKREFCSAVCRTAGRKIRTRPCEHCQKPIEKSWRKYCGLPCRKAATEKRRVYHTPPPDGHRHMWKIEAPNGPTSNGTCTICKTVRPFKNSLDEMSYFSSKNPQGISNLSGLNEKLPY